MYRRAVLLLRSLAKLALRVIARVPGALGLAANRPDSEPLVDLEDPYASTHSQRVSRYAVQLARAMGLPEDEVERIRNGGLMHDIGKIGVSDRILRKPEEQRTPEEQAKMRQHASISAEIIEHLRILGESAEMVRHHHENYDGSGYPDGLRGEAIPVGSRIIAVADSFDLLVTDRPYRKAATREQALAVIREHAGAQFDPAIVAVFERMIVADTGIVPTRS